MKVSVGVTLLNEEKSVGELLESLLKLTQKPDEIVIVDGGSTDQTVEIVRHFQKKNREIKLLVQKSNVAQGRNLCVELARNEIIAMTDADCTADKNWLKRITQPFENGQVDMVAGFYHTRGADSRQKALSYFLGVTPKRFDAHFLPSTRSVAFTKSLHERVGGYPEKMRAGEDTVFNARAAEIGAKIARAKGAIVYWQIPASLPEAFNKFSDYAKWDVKSKKLSSHNIKAFLIILRYLVGIILFVIGFSNNSLWFVLAVGLVLYAFWAFRKVYVEFGDAKTGLWGIFWQFIADLAVTKGVLSALVE